MALKTDTDKAKVRTAIKIYLALRGSATAKQLADFVNDCDLRVRANVNPSVIAKDLMYCSGEPKNFLNVSSYVQGNGARRYYLENKYAD